MKSQGVNPLLPFNRINTNDRGLTRKFDRCDDRVELVGIEIAFELFAGLPFLHEVQRLALIKVGVEVRLQAAGGSSRRTKQRTEGSQNCCASFIWCHDQHRENDQGSNLSAVSDPTRRSLPRYVLARSAPTRDKTASSKKRTAKQRDRKSAREALHAASRYGLRNIGADSEISEVK